MPSLILVLNTGAPVGVTGITINQYGARLPGCTVKAFNSVTNIYVTSTISDGSGVYSMNLPKGNTYFLVAYKPGSPDLAGTSVNTITVS